MQENARLCVSQLFISGVKETTSKTEL